MLINIENKKGLVFKDEKGNPLKGKNISAQWTRILKKCNITHKKFHSIRHTYASVLLKNGVDIETVAELMGHSTISITQIYLHSSNEQKQESVNKLNSLLKKLLQKWIIKIELTNSDAIIYMDFGVCEPKKLVAKM